MRELARIKRILVLLKQLWEKDQLALGYLMEKHVWAKYTRDIFYVEDTETESNLKLALSGLDGVAKAELSSEKQEILTIVGVIWNEVPDQRLGQLLSNYGFGHFLSFPPNEMLHQEDNVLLQNLKSCLRQQ